MVFAWIAIEALINDMLSDFAALPDDLFSVHEKGFLEELAVEFVRSGEDMGRFSVTSRTDYRRLEDKIMFLLAKFGKGTKLDKGSALWQKFEQAKDRRNAFVHPRKDTSVEVSPADAKDAIEVAEAVIQVVSAGVWGKPAQV